MTEKMLYECEICGHYYSDKKEAEECEKSHVKFKIDEVKYRGNKDPFCKYPYEFILQFEDGTRKFYR